jgi:hypothetical protein
LKHHGLFDRDEENSDPGVSENLLSQGTLASIISNVDQAGIGYIQLAH